MTTIENDSTKVEVTSLMEDWMLSFSLIRDINHRSSWRPIGSKIWKQVEKEYHIEENKNFLVDGTKMKAFLQFDSSAEAIEFKLKYL